MKRIYIIAMVASVVAGISLFNFLLNLQKESKVNFTEAVVAVIDIEAHTAITPEMLTVKQVPNEGVHPKAAKKTQDVIGLVTTEKILKDEQIILPKLKKVGENTGGLSYVIPENMRAITVAVDEISGMAGFINPGDKVDILGLVMIGEKESSKQASELILQNVPILAVGKMMKKETAEEKAASYTSVTLLMSPEDTVRLNLVATTGAMRLILRGPTDNIINIIEPKTANNVMNK